MKTLLKVMIALLFLPVAAKAQSPAGTTNDVQINISGSFGADSGKFTENPTTHVLSNAGSLVVGGPVPWSTSAIRNTARVRSVRSR